MNLTTNPHDKTKSTKLELRFSLTETPRKGSLSIRSTGLYRGVIIPVVGNESIGRIVKAGGTSRFHHQMPRSRKLSPGGELAGGGASITDNTTIPISNGIIEYSSSKSVCDVTEICRLSSELSECDVERTNLAESSGCTCP